MWLVLGFISLALIYNAYRNLQRRKKVRLDLVKGREPWDFSVLFQDHFSRFSASQDYVQFIWNEVAKALKVDPTLLRPEDPLEIFAAHNFCHNSLEDLEYLLNNQLPKGDLEDELDFPTVGDFVTFMAKNAAKRER